MSAADRGASCSTIVWGTIGVQVAFIVFCGVTLVTRLPARREQRMPVTGSALVEADGYLRWDYSRPRSANELGAEVRSPWSVSRASIVTVIVRDSEMKPVPGSRVVMRPEILCSANEPHLDVSVLEHKVSNGSGVASFRCFAAQYVVSAQGPHGEEATTRFGCGDRFARYVATFVRG